MTENATDSLEVERKFDIAPDVPVPPLGDGLRLGATATHELSATYLDTPDLALIRAKITLRRRTGGHDAGWHLKRPAEAGARVETHLPLSAGGVGQVPGELRAAVADIVGAQPLVPVAVLATTRVETNIRGEGGRVVAALCDDTVRATPAGAVWRELEVELADAGTPAVIETVTASFASAGVTESASPSKLSRALGDAPERAAEAATLQRSSRAGAVVMAYVAAQVGVIQSREQDVRDDAPDAVHKTRVATRRLRSVLRTFRDLFEPGTTEELRDEIRWLGMVLGGPRDAEVQKARLLVALEELPVELTVGPLAPRVTAELDRRHDEARADLLAALDGRRYAALRDRLAEFVAAPPLSEQAERPAADVVPGLVRASAKRTDKAWRRAKDASGHDRLVELHETRKKAKAARYACEAAEPAFGKKALRLREAYEAATEALGHVQDAVVGVEQLQDLARVAEENGEPGFSYGALAARELGASAESEREGLLALKSTTKGGIRDWLG